jgi:sugar phosphate permease
MIVVSSSEIDNTVIAGMPDSTAPATDLSRESPYRWVILGTVTVILSLFFIDRLAWANVAHTYAKANGFSPTEVGSFFSAFYLGYLVMNGLSGFAADLLGGKRVICVSLLCMGCLTASFGTTSALWAGLVIQAGMGFVAGADYSACIKLISVWFTPKDRTTAMGVFLCAAPLSLVLANVIVPTLMNAVGWRGVYFLLGITTLLVGFISIVLVREPPAWALLNREAPPKFGDLLRNPGLIIATISGFGFLWGVWGFAFWANALLVTGRELSPVRAGFIVACYGFSGIVANPGMGWIADRVGYSKRTILIGLAAVFAFCLVLFGHLESVPSLMICATILGLSASGAILVATMVVDAVDNKLAGSASGLAIALWSLGNVIVPVVVGAVYQWTSSFGAALGTLAAGPAAAMLMLLFGARWIESSRRGEQIVQLKPRP